MYGSNFINVIFKPRASSSAPIEAAAMPLPSPLTTPPVTKIYFGIRSSLVWATCGSGCWTSCVLIVSEPEIRGRRKSTRLTASQSTATRVGHQRQDQTGQCETGKCETGKCETGKCETGKCETGKCETEKCVTER